MPTPMRELIDHPLVDIYAGGLRIHAGCSCGCDKCQEVKAGGPGSGCQGANCGRPSSGKTSEDAKKAGMPKLANRRAAEEAKLSTGPVTKLKLRYDKALTKESTLRQAHQDALKQYGHSIRMKGLNHPDTKKMSSKVDTAYAKHVQSQRKLWDIAKQSEPR